MTFRIALSGLNAASAELSVTANNIANANTTGFKESRAQFSDLFNSGGIGLSDTQIGGGARLSGVQQQFTQGNINFTGNALDMSINGDGFFTLSDAGAVSYSRDGAFQVDRDGFMVSAEGLRLQGSAPTAGGGFNTAALSDIQLSTTNSAPAATTDVQTGLNLPADAAIPAVTPFDPADPDTFNQSSAVTVFDSLGDAHTLTSFYVKTANPNEWDLYTALDGAQIGGANPIVFDNTGQLTTPANGEFTLPSTALTNGAANLDMTFDISGASQYGDTFAVNSVSQDGFATGRLVGVEIAENGVVQARFTNGQTTALAQLAMTKFANPEGLQSLGDTSWAETFDSGSAQRGVAGTGGLGSIQSGALESSNVDLTAQLVNMITAQRNFQANAQMITTADQVTQAALNIR
ncbi:MAG: flagellar hook protein FlgE [Oceanococcus sp.]